MHPDIRRPIGGVKQIHRLAESLVDIGRQAFLIQDKADFHPGWFQSNVRTISRSDWSCITDLNPAVDTLILPETFLPYIHSYHKHLPRIIFNQNAAYSFGAGSQSKWYSAAETIDIYNSSSVSHVLCVSRHDYALLTDGFGLPSSKVSLIINGLEDSIFIPTNQKKRQIAFMTRKNTVDSQAVIALLNKQPWFQGWSVIPIENCSQSQVVQILQDSLLFLSFGHPEGFGLPVAEALACGCGLIGYSGLGGRELFSLAKQFQICKEIGFGDWLGFVKATQQFIKAFDERPNWLITALRQCSGSVISIYNQDSMRKSVDSAISSIESSL